MGPTVGRIFCVQDVEHPVERGDMLGGRDGVEKNRRNPGFRRELEEVNSRDVIALLVREGASFFAHSVGHAHRFLAL